MAPSTQLLSYVGCLSSLASLALGATNDGVPDLAYIKTRGAETNSVEVHIASSSSKFQARIFDAGITFGQEGGGTWQLVPSKNSALPDLVFIKTSNMPTGLVEETATVFASEEGNGMLDLVIKTQNTGTDKVEVHAASGSSNYSRFILGGADLVYIKDAGTGTGQVEVHIASKASGYQKRVFEAGTEFAQEANGVWSLIDYIRDGVLDLSYIKHQNTGTATVDVHVASG
ncbi:hypothetical protein CIB48_g10279 [Xylaria polymorpha]|nr:hypothetical protein CIB48_g10279 [Xylaria polymorpha]